jgi:Protein of unknown function (DUF3455)
MDLSHDLNTVSKSLLFGLFLAATAGSIKLSTAQAGSAPEVPSALQVPAGQKVIWQAHASGVQIYVCQAGADGKPQWVLKAPQAELRNDDGAVIGQHYAGPTWKHQDGSEVTGKVSARVDSPDTTSIPWLLLTASGHSGGGVLSRVTAIQRIHTKGGQLPSASCDVSRLDTEAKSPYTADYYFYAP